MAEPPFLTIPEFCTEYRTSRSYTFVLLREGRLKGVKVGKMTRIRRKDAQAWAKALPPAGRAKGKSEPKPSPLLSPPDQGALPLRLVAGPKCKPRRQKPRKPRGRLERGAAK
jgi:excisionase family DNA binding protein